ncbi:MAG TPA: SO_0444 family Cu/Zn efflux transporter [Thermoanaerobaculia bacterium]|nr:SO_0444 family Cu/Zn efflux transporter [Thermoanaerobaculia bacterium]
MIVLQTLQAVLSAAWDTFFLAAPFVLFGLLLAGLLHVLVSRRQLVRWMGGGGLAGAARAALLGIPLPLCSCGIVPVAISLRRQGASRPAVLSFLITTPESSADAVVLTWGLMGPLMALARLVAALASAMVAAVVTIAVGAPPTGGAAAGDAHDDPGHAHGNPGHGDPDHGHDHGDAGAGGDDDGYVGFRALWAALVDPVRRFLRPQPAPGQAPSPAAAGPATPEAAPSLAAAGLSEPPAAPSPTAATVGPAPGQQAVPLRRILRAVGQRAFVELVDDIVFWLVVGVLAAGVIAALVPADLVAATTGGGLMAMLLLMLLAVPMYVCASASTPIAAALIAKGVSPGAALVFLLAGPATNTATVTLLARHFGGRFLRVYLGCVLVVAVLCGLGLDALVAATGWRITGQLASQAEGVPAFFELLCALALLALVVWRLWAGAARQGVSELAANLRGLGAWLAGTVPAAQRARWRSAASRLLPRAAAAVAVAAYLLSGLAVVPPDAVGYEQRFGRIVARGLRPGLHWLPPRPFASLTLWRVHYPRRAEVGFHSDLSLLARRQELLRAADPAQWHSLVAAMNTDTREASYLAGDENLLEMSFSVHYGLADPYTFFYRLDREHDLVGLCAQAAARSLVAANTLDGLLTAGRGQLERALAAETQRRLDRLGAGVRVGSVHIVDLHPPQDAVFAFRDVSSAREDRDKRIQTALAESEKQVPRARGTAALSVAQAQAGADSARVIAAGNAEAFTARAGAFSAHRDILRDLLWLETAEKALPGRRKFIVPPGTAGRRVVLWPGQAPATPTLPPPPDGE